MVFCVVKLHVGLFWLCLRTKALRRRRRQRVGQFWSAAAGARWRPKKCCSKVPDKISFYLQNFLMTFLVIDRKLATEKVHSKNAIGGANKFSATAARGGRRRALV